MKVTFISDTHTKENTLNLCGGDILVFSGDCMSSGSSIFELFKFIEWFKEQNYTYKVFVADNHDRTCEMLPEKYIKPIFDLYYDNGVRYIKDELITVDGISIYGTPYQPYFYGWAFNVSDSEKLTNIYKNIPEGVDILITHCPPYDILDKSHLPREKNGKTGEEPLGSTELLNVLTEMENPPKYHCFGHIHGDGGKVEKKGETTYINASVCDEQYEPVNKVITLDI